MLSTLMLFGTRRAFVQLACHNIYLVEPLLWFVFTNDQMAENNRIITIIQVGRTITAGDWSRSGRGQPTAHVSTLACEAHLSGRLIELECSGRHLISLTSSYEIEQIFIIYICT